MDALLTQAQLVGYDPAPAAIGTVIPRAEFAETAARGEFPATMLLDLDRADARARVAVEWGRDTLEQLLASTDDQEIALWFDRDELARAFDEVEGHGLRERAALLAIAVTAAGAGATPALAGSPAVPMGVERAQLMDQQISGAQSPTTQRPSAQPMGALRGQELDRQISAGQGSPGTGAPAATSTGDSGLSPGEIAGIAGASAILISAAGFGFARKHTPPVQPA